MTKFKPDNSLEIAVGIKDPEEAKEYLKDYTAWIQKEIDKDPKRAGDNAESIAKGNIAYFAGYFDNATRERVEELYSCAHPLFGAIKDKEPPGPLEAFNMGLKMGEELKKQQENGTNKSK